MAGLINWKKVTIPTANPDTEHLYVGVDPVDCKLYIKDDTGTVFKYQTDSNVTAAINAALTNYDLSTVVDSKISSAISSLIDGAPVALDTLNELAAALADNENFAATVTASLAGKQPLDGDLTAIAALAGAGFAVRTTANTWATRSLTTPVGSGLGITNQDGVFGSPAFTNTDKGSVAVATHEAASDPHPQYYLAANPNGYETTAQLNARDTANRERANHTGTQAVGTITGLGALAIKNTVANSDIDNDAITSAKIGNAQVTSLKIADDAVVTARILSNAVTNTKLADMGANTLKGNNTGGVADPADLTTVQVRTMLAINNLDNTSDLNKPISTATQTALNLKENTITAGTLAQYWRGDKTFQTLDKSAVGLNNIDNTSDANKPVSIATQNALNLKADKAITISAGTGLIGGGDLSANRTLSLGNSGVTAGTYAKPVLTVDSFGRITSIRDAYKAYIESNTDTSTNLATNQTYLTLDVNAPLTGDYRIDWSAIFRMASTTVSPIVDVLLDGVGIYSPETASIQEHSEASTNERIEKSGFVVRNLTAGAHTIDLVYRSETGGSTITMYFGNLLCTEV